MIIRCFCVFRSMESQKKARKRLFWLVKFGFKAQNHTLPYRVKQRKKAKNTSFYGRLYAKYLPLRSFLTEQPVASDACRGVAAALLLSNLTVCMMIRQCAILFGCLAIGELIVFLTGVKLPSSIIGMLCLTLFLKLGWIKLSWVQGMSDFLVANLGFFFVPPGVALMLHFRVIAAEWLPIVTASVVSTLLVLVVTGWVHQLTRKIK